MLKILVVVVLVVILWSLGSALFHMAKKNGTPQQVARALTIRISLSVMLFLLLVLALYMGWIEPHDFNSTPGDS